jgi:hypothetical protein
MSLLYPVCLMFRQKIAEFLGVQSCNRVLAVEAAVPLLHIAAGK